MIDLAKECQFPSLTCLQCRINLRKPNTVFKLITKDAPFLVSLPPAPLFDNPPHQNLPKVFFSFSLESSTPLTAFRYLPNVSDRGLLPS